MVLNEISSVGFIAIVLIVFLLFPAVSASSAESENLLAEGVDMYNSGDRDAALQLFELLILIDPSWPYGWLWKGTVLADMGRDLEAEDAFKTGRCLLNPDACDDPFASPLVEVGDMHGTERFIHPIDGKGAENLEKDLQNNPVRNMQEKSVSHQYQEYGAGPLESSVPVQLEKEGDHFMENGEYDAALHTYLLAEQIAPENPDISRKTGDAYRATGNFNSALDAWNRSIQNETDLVDSDVLRKKRSEVFSTMNMPDHAIRELEDLKVSTNDPHVFHQKGELYSKLQDYALAEESFQNCISVDPGNIDASLGLAETRMRQGKIAKAKETLDSIPESALNPDQTNLLEKLKRDYTYYQDEETSDLSFLFSHPELYLLTGIGIFGIFYFRDKIFR